MQNTHELSLSNPEEGIHFRFVGTCRNFDYDSEAKIE
jgi:hypothetical protein